MKGGGHKIAAVLIAGDSVSNEQWDRCLSSLSSHVDEIFISHNGVQALPKDLMLSAASPVPITVEKTSWRDDFALARQKSFEMVPKDQFDWMIWVDTDDTLECDGSTLHELIDSLDKSTQGVFLRYDYAVEQETGKVVIEQWRERLLRTDGNWIWKFPVHEVCHGAPGTQYSRKPQFWVRHWRMPGENDERTRERNRRIIGKAMEREPHEPRHTFYMAGEMLAEADATLKEEGIDKAKPIIELTAELYTQFMKIAPWDDDTYIANHRLAECYRMLGDHNKAIDAELQGIKVFPSWPDSYIGIAQSYMAVGDWDKMRQWADLCLYAASKPETTQVIEPMNMDYMPHLLAGIANEELGNKEDALEHFEIAAKSFAPPELTEKICALHGEGVTETHSDVGGPSEKRKSLWGSRPERSIAFCTRPLFEPWHPELEKVQGAGGAETCIMRLAPLFARDGWRVSVFGTPGEHKGIDSDGVEWWESSEFDPQEPFTVAVSSRAPEVFDARLAAAKKLLWLHDVNLGPEMLESEWGDRLSQIDNVICLTEWHKAHTNRLYGIDQGKIAVVHNGVDISRFEHIDESVRDAGRFVYASSPDRGLDVLLTCWPKIKERIDEAQLHVFYGWDAIDKIIASQPDNHPQRNFLLQFKSGITGLIDQHGGEDSGIFWHGRVPQQRLADEYRRSDMWLYPTSFLETFCITAIETQLGGMIPCTTRIGALPEVVQLDGQMISGQPANFDYQDRFVDLVENTYRADEDTKTGWREQGRGPSKDFSWENAYERWKELIDG